MNEEQKMQAAAHPADVADQLERLPLEEAQQELRELPASEGAAVLAEMEKERWPSFLEGLEPREIAALLEELPHDEAADVLSTLDEEVREKVLTALPLVDRDPVAQILTYEPDTAGGIMTDQFIALKQDLTVQEAQEVLRSQSEGPPEEQPAYLYVVDDAGKLTGIVPVHELLFRPLQRKIGDIMKSDVKHVWVDDDQEKIGQLFDHYHFMALPVVARDRRLVGIVQANQVLEVLRREATEDMQLMVGLSGEERALTPWTRSLRRRLPWLSVNMVTAFAASAVVGFFEETIAAWTALAVFLPIVAGQGGNAGNQALTVVIRDMALGELSPGDGVKALRNEVMLGFANGLVIGLIVGVVSFAWKGSVLLGIIVGIAMVLNMVMAGVSGVLVPYTLRAMKIDPALASSIFVTTVTDVAGFFFFLGLASLAA